MKLKTLDSIEMDISIENLYIGRIANALDERRLL